MNPGESYRGSNSVVTYSAYTHRVFKAIQAGDKRQATSLQRLILKSTAARLLAIRQVTQLNAGKKTAGVDGKASLSFEERFALSEELKQSVNTWKHQKLAGNPNPKEGRENSQERKYQRCIHIAPRFKEV